MPPVQFRPWHQHVSEGGTWVGRFPSSKMITVSRTCRWKNCTRIAIIVAARSGHPSTGKFHGTSAVRKAILYVRSSSPGFVASQLRLPSAALPFCVCMFTARNPIAISSPYSLHLIQPLCLYLYKGPVPVILLPYAFSECFPTF